MERNIIEEPQLSHLLELLSELGNAADYFILVGARAMSFMVEKARSTKDFDFVLDAIALRGMVPSIDEILERLQYDVDPKARNFQFIKQIPDTYEKIRIEFLGSEKEKRAKNFRVDVQKNIHARACTGAEIVLRESEYAHLRGVLPNGRPVQMRVRLALPHALLMMKFFAMDDRYKNMKGSEQAKHDRDEARVHAADTAAIVHCHIQGTDFKKLFWNQFGDEVELKKRTSDILLRYFADLNSPGSILYAEFLRMRGLEINETEELNKTLREVKLLAEATKF